jgi:hypothetical protein
VKSGREDAFWQSRPVPIHGNKRGSWLSSMK